MFRKGILFYVLNFVTGLFFFSSLSYANTLESLDHLNSLAKEYIEKNITINSDEKLEISISDAGRQLQVATCDQPINVNVPAGASQQQISTLQMSCAGTQTWSVYVPINMKILTKIVVAKETIAGKEIISEEMLDYALYDKNSLFSGYYKDKNEVIGQSPVTAMVAGTVITKKNIQKPILIKSNQSVSIISRRGMILVKADGIAKSSGAINDIIRVLNPSSKRMIDATVVSSSSVEVR